jgi:hypothetical protein
VRLMMSERRLLVKVEAERYRRARKKEKGRKYLVKRRLRDRFNFHAIEVCPSLASRNLFARQRHDIFAFPAASDPRLGFVSKDYERNGRRALYKSANGNGAFV